MSISRKIERDFEAKTPWLVIDVSMTHIQMHIANILSEARVISIW